DGLLLRERPRLDAHPVAGEDEIAERDDRLREVVRLADRRLHEAALDERDPHGAGPRRLALRPGEERPPERVHREGRDPRHGQVARDDARLLRRHVPGDDPGGPVGRVLRDEELLAVARPREARVRSGPRGALVEEARREARGREALEDLAAVLAALLGLEDGEARLVPARFAREERRDSQPRLAVAARLGFSPQGTERLVTHDSI